LWCRRGLGISVPISYQSRAASWLWDRTDGYAYAEEGAIATRFYAHKDPEHPCPSPHHRRDVRRRPSRRRKMAPPHRRESGGGIQISLASRT
jgi:hypothetical protein